MEEDDPQQRVRVPQADAAPGAISPTRPRHVAQARSADMACVWVSSCHFPRTAFRVVHTFTSRPSPVSTRATRTDRRDKGAPASERTSPMAAFLSVTEFLDDSTVSSLSASLWIVQLGTSRLVATGRGLHDQVRRRLTHHDRLRRNCLVASHSTSRTLATSKARPRRT